MASVRGLRLRTAPLFLATLLLLFVTFLGSTMFGSANLSAVDIISTIMRHVGLGAFAPAEPLPRLLDALVWQARVPRVLLAAVVGAALAVSGAVLQSVTRNPLADPYLLGVASGASAGAVGVLMLGLGSGMVSLSAGAFVGSMMSFAALMALLGGGRVSNPARVVLTGVLVAQFFAAVTSVVIVLSGDAESTRGLTFWLLGTLAGARWTPLIVTGCVVLIGLVAIQFFARALDAFTFGWDSAAALGIKVRAARTWLLILTALITAAAVAASGAIAFVGLLVPHAVRIIAGPRHATLLPLSALVGAVFLMIVDTFARSAFGGYEFPAGVITALLGAPAFALVLRRVKS